MMIVTVQCCMVSEARNLSGGCYQDRIFWIEMLRPMLLL